MDLDKYNDITNNIEHLVKTPEFENNPHYPFISLLISQIKTHLSNLQIQKRKRSLDFLGSAWKWLAGSPDHHDHEIVLNKLNNVLENNNNQLLINKLTIEKVNEITNITNKILKVMENDEHTKNDLSLKLKFKLEVIKEEVVNIAYAIHWAKANIINSYILSNEEIGIAKNIVNRENLPFINLDEALEFSEIKIATNGKLIIYIISLPTVKNDICKTIEIRAVKHEKRINKINFNEILICEKEIYGIKNNCKNYNNLEICLSNHIIDLSTDTCINNLLKSRTPNCTVVNNQHIPTIEEITPGILFLNRFNGDITIGNETTLLNGTFLVHFSNITIEIQGKTYRNEGKITSKPLPAILQPLAKTNTVEEILSLQMLHQLNANNTKYISSLEKEGKIKYGISLSATIMLIIVIIAIGKFISTTWNKKSIQLTPAAIEGLNQFFNKTSSSNEDV